MRKGKVWQYIPEDVKKRGIIEQLVTAVLQIAASRNSLTRQDLSFNLVSIIFLSLFSAES